MTSTFPSTCIWVLDEISLSVMIVSPLPVLRGRWVPFAMVFPMCVLLDRIGLSTIDAYILPLRQRHVYRAFCAFNTSPIVGAVRLEVSIGDRDKVLAISIVTKTILTRRSLSIASCQR